MTKLVLLVYHNLEAVHDGETVRTSDRSFEIRKILNTHGVIAHYSALAVDEANVSEVTPVQLRGLRDSPASLVG
jgi:hypothetical protein